MTEERLQEIKDSIDIQKEFMDMKNYATELVEEKQELYDEVIRLQQENERLKKELNKHIKEGIEKDQIIFSALEYINDGSVFDGSGMCANDLRLLLRGIIVRSDKE